MLRDSDICEVCCKRFRVGQSLDVIPLGNDTRESERVYVYVHVKCAAPYRETKQREEEEIKKLAEEYSQLDYLARAAKGKAHGSSNQKALRRQRRLKRQLLEKTQGPGWTADQWEAVKRKYHYRCVCCRRKGLNLEPDHVDPIDKRGAHRITNIQPLCKPCNMKKSARYKDYRPNDVHQWEREIRGLCRFGTLTTKPCQRLAVDGTLFCNVHRRDSDRKMH